MYRKFRQCAIHKMTDSVPDYIQNETIYNVQDHINNIQDNV